MKGERTFLFPVVSDPQPGLQFQILGRDDHVLPVLAGNKQARDAVGRGHDDGSGTAGRLQHLDDAAIE